MSKIVKFFAITFVSSFVLLSLFGASPSTSTLLIDDFKDGNLTFNPEWFVFGDAASISVEKRSLMISGSGSPWYVGGVGTYLGVDVRQYSGLMLRINGHQKFPCRLKIELFDDDNNNWHIEQDLEHNFVPLYDDKWVYELPINWEGQKSVFIPFNRFKVANPKTGDDKWNPYQTKASGGLIQLQLVALSPQERPTSKIMLRIASLSFSK